MRDAFIRKFTEIANEDKRLVLITGDLGFCVFDEIRQTLPDQFINAGVAEQNMTAVATGMAMGGFVTFTYSIGNFPTLRCLEQIRNDACYHGADVKVVSIGGGFSYGALGISHHATEDLAILRSLPDITVFSPTSTWETERATEALVETPGTCFLRLDKSFANEPGGVDDVFQTGRNRLLRDGDACSLFVTGGIMEEAWHVAEKLSRNGIEIRLYSVHTLKPFDISSVVQAAEETGVIVTLEEHNVDGGLGGLVAETLMDAGVDGCKFRRIGLRAGFSSIVGSQHYLRQRYELDADAVYKSVKDLLAQ